MDFNELQRWAVRIKQAAEKGDMITPILDEFARAECKRLQRIEELIAYWREVEEALRPFAELGTNKLQGKEFLLAMRRARALIGEE